MSVIFKERVGSQVMNDKVTNILATPSRYSVFISYNRAVDGKLAPKLQGALQSFARPWNGLRALRVFRDDANLSANPGL